MQNVFIRRGAAVACGAAALILAAAPVRAQESTSAPLVKQLTQLLDSAKLTSVAAADTANLGTYVAALYIPGTQLLVVSAKYAAPPLLNEKIGNKNYRDVYIDLSSASEPGTKLFVMDSNADGVLPKPPENKAFDSAEQAGTSYTFDGEWKKAKMSEADYMKHFQSIDAAYAKALQVLIGQMQAGGGA
ncbi:MAG TPA: hypothetical protein VFX12_06530 [Vicinamibacterales bacterium]|nr:hypothetical protein [Vicinamibacterales bacterium]